MMTTEWHAILIRRLAESARLLGLCDDTRPFAVLAATEAIKLTGYRPEDETSILNMGFIRQFGRHCIEEKLLRMRQEKTLPEALNPAVEALLSAWDLSDVMS